MNQFFHYDVQNAAVNALKHFVEAYLVAADTGGTGDITSKYLQMLTDPNVAIRRGSAVALGVLPYEFLVNRWRDVLLKLCSASAIEVQLTEVAIFIEIFNCYRTNE